MLEWIRHTQLGVPWLVIMILRVYAIYDKCSKVLILLLSLWLGQIVISAVGLRTGYRMCHSSFAFPLLTMKP